MKSEGYNSDSGYTYGYYRVTAPVQADFVLAFNGIACRSIKRVLELGVGNGVSAAVHACANDIEFWGCDFMPEHAYQAQEFCSPAGSACVITDESFEVFARRKDLPMFDMISLHGIWSWVSARNRALITDLVGRVLNPGGVLYVSYNCLPGWAPFLPIQKLLRSNIQMLRAGGWTSNMVKEAIERIQALPGAEPSYLARYPDLREVLKKFAQDDPRYVEHELVNDNWTAFLHSDVARQLADAKLSFGSSASLYQDNQYLALPPAAQKLLMGIDDIGLREATKDVISISPFRQDYFVKGKRELSPYEKRKKFAQFSFLLVGKIRREGNRLKVQDGKEMGVDVELWSKLETFLASDESRIKTFVEIEQFVREQKLPMPKVLHCLAILVAADYLHVSKGAPGSHVVARTKALNDQFMSFSLSRSDLRTLASPLTGQGFGVNRLDQLFFLANRNNRKTASEMAQMVFSILAPQNQMIAVGGKALASAEENVAELTKHAHDFLQNRLPILGRLAIA